MFRKIIPILVLYATNFQFIFSQPQNFEGIIKYIPLSPAVEYGDTLINYYSKNKIKITRTGMFVNKAGGLTDEVIDFENAPNTSLFYFAERNDLEVFESKVSGIDSTKIYPDSVVWILGFPCVKHEVYYQESEYMGTHRLVVSNWATSYLHYLAPKTATTSALHPDYSDGSIPLKYERKVYSKMVDGTSLVTSTTMIACEIIIRPLPDHVFKVP